MIKITPNILVKSLDSDRLVLIQSTGEYDYREIIPLKNNQTLLFCVDTDKLAPIIGEGLIDIIQESTKVTLKTEGSEYTLPIFRERGVLMVQPEIDLPQTPIKETWEDDFSEKIVNTKGTNLISQNHLLVTMGPDYIARVSNNIMEEYGKGQGLFSIFIKQYTLLMKMGKVKVNYFESGELQVIGENSEVRIRRTALFPNLVPIKSAVSQNSPLAVADLSKLKLKTLDKFILEKIYIEVRNGAISFILENARKTVEAPDIKLSSSITMMLNSSNLKYILGEISIYPYKMGNKETHLIVSRNKEKTTYILAYPAPNTLVW